MSQTFEHLHWLPVHHCVEYKLALFTYKIYHSSEPLHLCSQLADYTPVSKITEIVRQSFTCCAKDKAYMCGAMQAFSIVAP